MGSIPNDSRLLEISGSRRAGMQQSLATHPVIVSRARGSPARGGSPVGFYEKYRRWRLDRAGAQGVSAAAAGASLGALRRRLTLADLSWPQAAMMSSPRGVRTGEEYPAALTMSENSLIAAALERS